MVLFMNLMFQQTVIPRPEGSHAEGAGYVPRISRNTYKPLKTGV